MLYSNAKKFEKINNVLNIVTYFLIAIQLVTYSVKKRILSLYV